MDPSSEGRWVLISATAPPVNKKKTGEDEEKSEERGARREEKGERGERSEE